MNLKKYLNEQILLFFGLLISVLIIVFTEFIIDLTPENNHWCCKILRLLNNLSLSFVSAYIFYAVVVLIPGNRKKKNIYGHIYRASNLVIGDGSNILNELCKEAGAEIKTIENVTHDELREILKKINPKNVAPMMVSVPGQGDVYLNWIEYLFYYENRSLDFINNRILNLAIYLDEESELVSLVTNIKDSHYFRHLKNTAGVVERMKNTDITFFSRQMFEYFMALKNLKSYSDTKLKKYIAK